MKLKHDLKTIARQFLIHGDFLAAEPYGSGHINDTYAVTFSQGGAPVRYIIQRINHMVFQKPLELVDNIRRVTEHIREKLRQEGVQDASRRGMTLIPARTGAPCHQDAEGNIWRTYIFIENARTLDKLETPRQAFEGARAFGAFQQALADLPTPPLHDTIPNFHNAALRYQAFEEALSRDALNRAASAKKEIEFLQAHTWIFDILPELVRQGRIPIRITHNDTKINNVLLDDQTGEGICVIDLDTVMPGVSLYDFGDMVRTSTSPVDEDERDLDKVTLRLEMFEQLVRGFLSSAGAFLNIDEKLNLVLGGKLITQIIGTRFLTDYLLGDVYFKIHREGHNLDRCRTQFKLVESMIQQEEVLNDLVESLAQKDPEALQVSASGCPGA